MQAFSVRMGAVGWLVCCACNDADVPATPDDPEYGKHRDAGEQAPESDAAVPDEPDAGMDDTTPRPSGCALVVSAASEGATVANTIDLFGAELSIDLWVRFAALPAVDVVEAQPQRVVWAENVTSHQALSVEVSFGELGCVVRDGAVEHGAMVTAHAGLASGWHHIGCVLDAGGMHMWLDGVWMATAPDAMAYAHDGSPLHIGGGRMLDEAVARPGNAFRGSIDELRISDAALWKVDFAGSELDADTFAPEPRADQSASTAALWHFDACGASSAEDAVGARDAELSAGSALSAQ